MISLRTPTHDSNSMNITSIATRFARCSPRASSISNVGASPPFSTPGVGGAAELDVVVPSSIAPPSAGHPIIVDHSRDIMSLRCEIAQLKSDVADLRREVGAGIAAVLEATRGAQQQPKRRKSGFFGVGGS